MHAMESKVARRRFVGSALSLGAGAAFGATLSFPTMPISAAAGGGGRDLVHEELVRQMKATVRAIRGQKPGEAARTLAGQLRVLAAHHRSSGVDEDMQKRLRAAIARDGRDAVLQYDPEAAMLIAEAPKWGLPTPVPRGVFDLTARERALNALLSGGATAALLSTATELERVAEHMDRLPVSPVAARQSCYPLQGPTYFIEYVALASCLVNPILCAGFSGAYFGLKISIWYFGC